MFYMSHPVELLLRESLLLYNNSLTDVNVCKRHEASSKDCLICTSFSVKFNLEAFCSNACVYHLEVFFSARNRIKSCRYVLI